MPNGNGPITGGHSELKTWQKAYAMGLAAGVAASGVIAIATAIAMAVNAS